MIETKYKIATIPGDGIGPEVMAQAITILEAIQDMDQNIEFEFTKLLAGDTQKEKTGVAMSPEIIEAVRESNATLFAAVGATAKEVILPLRQHLDLYANIRPIKTYPNVPAMHRELDMVIVRENTEGLYKMVGYRDSDWGVNLRIITLKASLRIAESAFKLAERERRKKVTAVHKNNVLDPTCGIFLEACRKVSEAFPAIAYDEMIVDACAMKLILSPCQFDVIVTTNMFGDILSDEAAGLVGGLGMAPSANIGDRHAIFEPVHGTAPDIAGKGISNPIAMILSASMMLEWLGESNWSKALEDAVIEVLKESEIRTPDLSGNYMTIDVTNAVISKLKQT